jgi:hypothetical protein
MLDEAVYVPRIVQMFSCFGEGNKKDDPSGSPVALRRYFPFQHRAQIFRAEVGGLTFA